MTRREVADLAYMAAGAEGNTEVKYDGMLNGYHVQLVIEPVTKKETKVRYYIIEVRKDASFTVQVISADYYKVEGHFLEFYIKDVLQPIATYAPGCWISVRKG